MRRVSMQMSRYGEPDFDVEYLRWGFPDCAAQIVEAESILGLIGSGPHKILDLACGIGTHAIHWAQHGHTVLGVDLSATFIKHATDAAREIVGAQFLAADIRKLKLHHEFTIATWIEMSFIDVDVLRCVHQALSPGGYFICDVRNPEHAKIKAHSGNWRTWREEGGVFTLERHELNPQTGKQEDAWITINPALQLIEEKTNVSEPGLKIDPLKMIAKLKEAGFPRCELRTLSGALFEHGSETYWLWIIAQR